MTPTIIGLGALIVTLLAHTAALFYWGGGVRQILRDHERRIGVVEKVVFPAVADRRSVPREEYRP